MKTSLLNLKALLLISSLIIFGTGISFKCAAQGDTYPLSEISFTGASTVCLNAASPNLVYSFNTDNCGSNPFSPVDITVTWYSNTTNSTGGGSQVWQEISTSATTTFSYSAPTNTPGTLYYYVEVSWGTGFITCATPATLVSNETQQVTVNSINPLSVSIGASATTICNGSPVTFTATPVNAGASPSYQWQVNGVNAGPDNPVFTTSTIANNDLVTVILTADINACVTGNPATSNVISMTVNQPLPASVSISASSTNICAGTPVTFTAAPINGGTTPSYQWQVNGVNAGTNNPVFTTSALTNNDVVTVIMTADATSCATGSPATSNSVTMTVSNALPVTVSIGASATTICAGTTVTFTATPVNGGATPSYQWQVNGINAGTNNPVFTTNTLSNGNVVTVVMTSSLASCISGNPATSNSINMTVNSAPPVVNITTAGTTLCQGTIQSLSAASGTSSIVSSGTISAAIPDFNAAGVTNTLNVSGIPVGAVITGMSVEFNIAHLNVGDLIVNLKAPNNNILNFVNKRGGTGDNFSNTVVSSSGVNLFSAGAAPFTGTFAADAALAVGATGNNSNVASFNSLYSTANGNWVISIRDAGLNSIGGTLTSWTITINWSYPITWSPITDLYSDAGATVPYTNGQILSTVYVKPSTAGSIIYTATATGSNGCTNTGTVSLTVDPTPTVSATPATQSVCSGTAITQIDITNPNNVPGTTYSWTRTTPVGLAGIANSGTGPSISGTFTNSTAAPITTTFTITATAGTCSSSTTVTVTVNPVPTVSATNTSQTVCSGTAITNIIVSNPNGVSGTALNWTRDNTVNLTGIAASGTGNIAGTLTNNTNVQQTTVFTITAIATGCSSTTTATIIVNPKPTVNATPASQTVCSGTAITQIDITNPNNVSGTTYAWTRTTPAGLAGIAASGSGSSISGTFTNSTAAPITSTFTITATAGTCSSTTTVTVTVNPIPTVSATNTNQTKCSGTAITTIVVSNPNAVSGTVLSWTRDNTINLTGIAASGTGNISGTLINNTNVQQTTVFTITASAGGCSSVTTATVIINPTPVVSATPLTQTICSATAITQIDITNPNAVAGTTYSWTRDNTVNLTGMAAGGSGSAITGTLTNNTNVQQTTIFTITATSGSCTSTTTVNVKVNPTPTVNAVSNASFCNNANGAAINFGSNVAGATYSWTSTVNVGFGLSGNGNIPAYVATGGPVTTTVSVTATAAGCTGPVRTFTITINPLPTVTITADYCSVPGKVRLTANPLPAGTYTYLWTTGQVTSFIDVDIAGLYGVTVTNTNGCKATNSISVANELAINGSFEAGNSGFTSGYTYNATGSGLVPEGRYAVNSNPNFNHPNFWGTDHTTGTGNMMIINGVVGPTVWQETVTVVPNTTYYFSAWALSMNNSSPFAQLQFSVNGSPIGVSAVLVAGVNNNASNTNWQRFYGTWSSGALTTATCSIVDLQGALGGNDFALDDISISTLSPAAFYVFPSVVGGGTSVCQGSTLNLSANLAGGSSPYTFSWTGPAGFTSNLQNPTIANASAANAGTYTVTATDFYGCVISASRVINVSAPPAAASPVTATPSTICLGSSTNLNGTTPSGTQADFAGFFATGNWITTNNPALTGGSVNLSGAPTYISITSGDNATAGNTDYTITNGPVAGNFTFNWSYSSDDASPANDIPQYSINGGAAVNMPGFNTAGALTQSGTATIAVPANQTFALRMRTTNGTGGAATVTIKNFAAPVTGKIAWYTVPSAGASIGNSVSAANFSVTPGSTGVISYYAEAINSVGCISTSRTSVNVTVNTSPAFSLCPSNIVTTVTAGTCSKAVTYSATATGSAAPTLTYTFTGATTGSGSGTGSGSTFNKGVTTVTITANTGCAPNATCSFTITVNDNIAPTFTTCPANATRNTAAGVCTYTAVGSEFNSVATDNCSVTSNTATLTGATTGSGFATLAAKVFNKGVTTVTWTASDGSNTATCVFTVTVNDNQSPVFSVCPANATRNTAAGVCTYTSVGNEFNSTATDNCSVTSKTATLTGATTGSGLASLTGQVFNKGVTTVTWTATDGTNNTTCVFTVTVNDNQAPVFSLCPSNATRNANVGSCTYTAVGNEFNSTATDNCSVTSKTATLTGATTGSGLATLTGQVFNKGVTTVTWVATDGTNNTNCVFTVTVNDNQAPVFSACPSNTTRNTNTGVCTYTAVGTEFNSTATDNCSLTSNTATLTGATTGAGFVTLAGKVFNKGVTTITWTASDGVNSTPCVFTVTVVDNEVPVINCLADVVTCNPSFGLTNPSFSDNCPGVVISNNAPPVFPIGTTVVTFTATDASGNTATCTQQITLSPAAPATPGAISGLPMVCEQTAGLVYSVAPVANATVYNWTVPTGWTITSGAGTSSIVVTSGSAGQNGNISVTSGNFCGTSPSSTSPVSLTSRGTWLGFNTNWNNPSNWCGGVPTSTTDVIIPLVASGHYPVISTGTALSRNITIGPGASLKVDDETLKVSGSLMINGVFDVTDGELELDGTAGMQSISGSAFLDHTIDKLKISNVNGVSLTGINDTLKISGTIKFGVSNAILHTNNNLTLLSSATGTASVGDMTNNGANSGNDITGNVTVERYIPNHFKAWQFLAVPTKGQTINAAWQEGNTPLANTTHPGYGTIITSNVPGAVGLGFDIFTPAGPTMKSWDALSASWQGVPDPSMLIDNKKGYMLLVRGDRSVTVFNQPATQTILRTTGKLYTIGGEAPPVTNVNAGTFESIGNPYASAIDFNNVTKTGGVQDIFYVWDPKLTINTYSAYGLGAYQTFVGPGPAYTVVPGGGSYTGNNTQIESGQAFFVNAPFNPGTVVFTESCKVDGSNLVTRPVTTNTAVKQIRNNLYVIISGNPVLLDGTIAQFDASYSNSVDDKDAVKLTNTSENLCLMRNGKKLVAERRAEVQDNDTLYYNLGLLRVQQYQFEFIARNFDPAMAAFLEDNYLHTTTPVDLLQDTTKVMFNVVNVPGSYAADRFRLVFKQLVPTPVTITSIAANRNSDKSIAVSWKVENETNIQLYTVERSEDGRNFTGILTAAPVANNGGSASYARNDISPLAMDNFYRIKALSVGGQIQYSPIVKVAPLKSIRSITVYPNPVSGKTIQIHMTDAVAGTYSLQLTNKLGQVVYNGTIQVNTGSMVKSVALPNEIASGNYQLNITEPDGTKNILTLMIE